MSSDSGGGGGTFTDDFGSTFSGGSQSDLGASTSFGGDVGGGSSGGGLGGILSGILGGGGGQGQGGGGNSQLLIGLLEKLLSPQQTHFGGSFPNTIVRTAAGQTQPLKFGASPVAPPTSPAERLAMVMRALG